MQVYHYHNDHLGTPNELTSQDGEVVWLADYEAWGNTSKIVWRQETLEQLQVSADEIQPLRFQGQSYDIETGLHYNRFRYFDPDLGMFISRDPIGLMGGNNVFAYAPNPTGWIDPFGLSNQPLKDCCKKEKCKGKTEPTLPPGTVVKSGSVKIEHYYKTNDHGPAHMHVVGGGKTTRIGSNGKPLRGDPELSSPQKKVVDANLIKIRNAGNKIGRWLAYQEECD